MPTDDDIRLKLLAEIERLRGDLDRVEGPAQARALKARLVELHEASIRDGVGRRIASIVDEFFVLAKASIVNRYGTAAWEDAEAIEEAKARIGTQPTKVAAREPPVVASALTDDTGPPTDEDLASMFRGATKARELFAECGLDVSSLGDVPRLVAEVLRLRSDEWLQRATDEIGSLDTREGYVDTAKVLAILRKHRDGKA